MQEARQLNRAHSAFDCQVNIHACLHNEKVNELHMLKTLGARYMLQGTSQTDGLCAENNELCLYMVWVGALVSKLRFSWNLVGCWQRL